MRIAPVHVATGFTTAAIVAGLILVHMLTAILTAAYAPVQLPSARGETQRIIQQIHADIDSMLARCDRIQADLARSRELIASLPDR
jgi:hypothetical protein